MNSKELFERALAIDAKVTNDLNNLFVRGLVSVQKYLKALRAIGERNYVRRYDERGLVGFHVWA